MGNDVELALTLAAIATFVCVPYLAAETIYGNEHRRLQNAIQFFGCIATSVVFGALVYVGVRMGLTLINLTFR